jgi:flavodoxin
LDYRSLTISPFFRLSEMTKYLVAYYSWTGNTAKVAKVLAEKLSADIEQIQDVKLRGGPFAFASSAFASVFHMSAPIMAATKDVANYDIVILGSPVWGANMATPVRTYIMREKPRIKQVGLFCTLGGSGGKAVLARMAALCGRTSLADLVIDQPALASDSWRGLAENFAQQVRSNAVAAPSAEAA